MDRFSEYRIMWVLVFFVLVQPRDETEERKLVIADLTVT